MSETHFAFVLLSRPGLPAGTALAKAWEDMAPAAPSFAADESDEALTLQGELGMVIIGEIPSPIPNGEAERAAERSAFFLGTDAELPPHTSHLVVSYRPSADLTRLIALHAFTRILGAVLRATTTRDADAARAVAVYWGGAGATHPAADFLETAIEMECPVVLWNGVSVSRAGSRVELLSLGMGLLGHRDLLLAAPTERANEALSMFFDLLSYVIEREEDVPEGETVGRTPEEKLVVRHVRSPIDRSKQVWRVDLP
jgi:hypothetical protein